MDFRERLQDEDASEGRAALVEIVSLLSAQELNRVFERASKRTREYVFVTAIDRPDGSLREGLKADGISPTLLVERD